jgi:hypothetical protein
VEAASPQPLLPLLGLKREHGSGRHTAVLQLASEGWGPRGQSHTEVLDGNRNGMFLTMMREPRCQSAP